MSLLLVVEEAAEEVATQEIEADEVDTIEVVEEVLTAVIVEVILVVNPSEDEVVMVLKALEALLEITFKIEEAAVMLLECNMDKVTTNATDS